MNNLRILLCSLLFATSAPSFAFDKTSVTISFVNLSHQTLTYTGVTGSNPGNEFTVTPTTIYPGETATITGDVTERTSLAGELHFEDAQHNQNIFFVLDKLQFKLGSPLFALDNERLYSIISDLTKNKEVDPVALQYVSVKVTIKDNTGM